MKFRYLKSVSTTDRRRIGVALSFLACISLTLTSSVAQLKTQRRVMGLQLGPAAEGSRVTIVSDSPLNDYEGFRRGDRFYVKIPLADFMSGMPQFRADGFENVQVQKVGEGLVVSFKLQPGASARINQYGNRLDVVFSAPNRLSSNSANSTASGNSGTGSQPSSNRGPDAAGPVPPVWSTPQERFGAAEPSSADRSSVNRLFRNNRSTGHNNADPNQAVAIASPIPSPSTTFSPAPYTSYPPLVTATPASSGQAGISANTGPSNWSNRKAAAVRWMSANRLATLLGALILLSLLVYAAAAIFRRKKNDEQAKRTKEKVQPKFSPNEKLDELPAAASEPISRQASVAEQPASSASSASATAWSQPAVLTRPTIVSPTTSVEEQREHGSEEEREVFEL